MDAQPSKTKFYLSHLCYGLKMGAFLLKKQNRNKNVTSVFAIILKRIRKTGEKLSLIYKLRQSVYEFFFESYKCTEIKTILLWKMRIKKERILKQERKTVKKVIKNRQNVE